MPVAITTAKAALADLLREHTSLTVVETKRGGLAAWERDPAPLRSYCEVHVGAGAPLDEHAGTEFLYGLVATIFLWMPHSYEDPSTTEPWEALLDEVVSVVNERRFDLHEEIPALDPARLILNDYVEWQGPEATVVCHHAQVQVTIDP